MSLTLQVFLSYFALITPVVILNRCVTSLRNSWVPCVCSHCLDAFIAHTTVFVQGVDNYYSKIKEMIGYYPSSYMKYCWKFITPSICFVSKLLCLHKYVVQVLCTCGLCLFLLLFINSSVRQRNVRSTGDKFPHGDNKVYRIVSYRIVSYRIVN